MAAVTAALTVAEEAAESSFLLFLHNRTHNVITIVRCMAKHF